MQTVATGIVAAKGRAKFEAAIAGLKRGDTLARALEQHAPGLPFYVYAMLRVGEATGQVGEVMREAADQMAYEDRLRRDFISSLTYPAFLILVGIGAVSFIFTVVVPRFNQMIGSDRDKMPLISKVVFGLADLINSHALVFGAAAAILVFAVVAAFSNKAVKAQVYNASRSMPAIGPILKARELTAWARLLGFALKNGVNLLDAAALARQGAPPGGFRNGLEQFERDLKAGVDVADSLSRHTELTGMDLSLLRAGAKSGNLPQMFLYVAESYDNLLRDRLTRFSSLIQPIAIFLIAMVVALLAV
jgi:general secretion pathway protein F